MTRNQKNANHRKCLNICVGLGYNLNVCNKQCFEIFVRLGYGEITKRSARAQFGKREGTN